MDRTDKVKANLKISEITKEHLGTLTLTAKNEYGTKFATLSLREGSAKPEPKPVPEVESKNEQESKDSPSEYFTDCRTVLDELRIDSLIFVNISFERSKSESLVLTIHAVW